MAPRRKRNWGWVIAAIVLVVVAVVVAVPFLIPTGAVRDRVVVAVRQATGRELDIKGELKLSLLPTLGVTAQDVSLSNAPWAGPGPMVALDRLDVGVKVLPLLAGRIEVARFILERPQINLATDKQGRGNWQFTADRKPASSAPGRSGAEEARSLALEDVSIDNGRVVYTDGVTGKTETLDNVTLSLSLPGSGGPLTAEGAATWRERVVHVAVNAVNFNTLMSSAGSQVGFKLSSDFIKASFDGTLAQVDQGPQGEGLLSLQAPSARELVGWVTGKVVDVSASGLGPLDIEGRLALSPNRVTLTGLNLSLDNIKGSGQLAAENGLSGPSLVGRLDFDMLDLSPYLPPASANAGEDGQGGAGGPRKPPEGWSAEPINAQALNDASLDLAVTANGLKARKLEVGKTAANLGLKGGKLDVELSEMAAYQGQVRGKASIDAAKPALAVEAALALVNVQAEPLVQALAGSDNVTGAANGEATLTSHGASERDLIGALDGKGRFAFTDGTVKGVDLAALAGDFTGLTGSGGKAGGSGATAFAKLQGTFVINDGILSNDDLVLDSAALQGAGKGSVDLPRRTVDYRIETKLLAPAALSAGKTPRSMTVPVIVEGPWDALRYRPDVAGIAEQRLGDPSKLLGNDKLGDRIQKTLPKLFGR